MSPRLPLIVHDNCIELIRSDRSCLIAFSKVYAVELHEDGIKIIHDTNCGNRSGTVSFVNGSRTSMLKTYRDIRDRIY